MRRARLLRRCPDAQAESDHQHGVGAANEDDKHRSCRRSDGKQLAHHLTGATVAVPLRGRDDVRRDDVEQRGEDSTASSTLRAVSWGPIPGTSPCTRLGARSVVPNISSPPHSPRFARIILRPFSLVGVKGERRSRSFL